VHAAAVELAQEVPDAARQLEGARGAPGVRVEQREAERNVGSDQRKAK
jgi:hypothetical protein